VQIGKVLHGDFSVSWGQEHGGFFRPLFIWSYVVDSRIWGARPFGYSPHERDLQRLNAFLVFRSLQSCSGISLQHPAPETGVAIAAAALFLLHPSHTEAVTWISGRADLIATFFVLVSLLAYLAYANSARTWRLIASLACL